MAYRRRRDDYWDFPLPWQMEWGIIGVAAFAWLVGTVVWYFWFWHKLQAPMDMFAQMGVPPPTQALNPILEMAAYAEPFICFPFAYGVWKTVRRWLLKRMPRF